jgi:[ribulose-bisphosphate carboxylase]-lysine N-methyltransferase
VEASRALYEGEPVAMDFGPSRTEGQVLLDHGAIDPSAVGGTFALTVTLPLEDRFRDDKLDVLEGAGLGESNEFVLRAGAPPPPPLLASLRLLNLSGPDAFLLESIFRNDVWETLQLPVTEENERAVYESMAAGCGAALAGYPASLDQDLEAQRGAAPGSRAAAAAAVRLGEREALDAALRFFEGRLEQLGDFEYYADRRLKRLGLLDKEGKPTDWESFFDEGIA